MRKDKARPLGNTFIDYTWNILTRMATKMVTQFLSDSSRLCLFQQCIRASQVKPICFASHYDSLCHVFQKQQRCPADLELDES